MQRQRRQRDASETSESRGTALATDHEKTVFFDLVEETIPGSDEAVRETLEEHQTEAEGE